MWKILKRAGVQNAEEVARGIFRKGSSKELNTFLMEKQDILEFKPSAEMANRSASDETTIIMGNKLLIARLVFFRAYIHYLTLQSKADRCRLLHSLFRGG